MRLHKSAPRDGMPADTSKPSAPERFESATLDRLMAEVRNARPADAGRYNRMHNRHNRS